jgi:hypothetical protein
MAKPVTTPYGFKQQLDELRARIASLEYAVYMVAARPDRVLNGIGSPIGVVTATGPALYLDRTDPKAPIIYTKSTQETNNTDWV